VVLIPGELKTVYQSEVLTGVIKPEDLTLVSFSKEMYTINVFCKTEGMRSKTFSLEHWMTDLSLQ